MRRYYYFAYGSNMDKEQMKFRCPGAVYEGVAVLHGYKLTERRYADIDKSDQGSVSGLLWNITETDLKALDRYEGYPSLYERKDVTVIIQHSCGCTAYPAFAYIMTPETKVEREGQKYSEYYRDICSRAAQVAGIKDEFSK